MGSSSSRNKKPVVIGRKCNCDSGGDPSKHTRKIGQSLSGKKKQIPAHCCQLNGCLSGIGSLVKMASTQKGHQVFSIHHNQALTETLLLLIQCKLELCY